LTGQLQIYDIFVILIILILVRSKYSLQPHYFAGIAGHKETVRFELTKVKVAEPISPQETITNTIGMKFVLIPAGSLTMGSRLSPGEVTRRYGGKAEWYKDEQPPHPVEITRPFYLQTTEVSQAQWKRIMGNNPSRFEDCGDDCPVEKVSWNDAQKFIEELNQMEDINKYRLPTEAEWEYACRAKTETAYSFGDEVDKLGEYAWYGDNSGGKTKPVGKKKPNAWGLYDMHGNVWEWVQDRYGDYPTGPIPDPKGPDKGEYRVLRGGSWSHFARILRSAYRGSNFPDDRSDGDGFRVARDF
jgi:formylglycine-generating enzyme required for sulfatase activity